MQQLHSARIYETGRQLISCHFRIRVIVTANYIVQQVVTQLQNITINDVLINSRQNC